MSTAKDKGLTRLKDCQARIRAAQDEAVYIGVHHFRDEQAKETPVYDWRAPIASMFYDHEIGMQDLAGELLDGQ